MRNVLPSQISAKLSGNVDKLTARELFAKVSDIIESWREKKIRIAFIGSSGTGKSSLINALRELTADDEEAAAVGPIETTRQRTIYPHPRNRNVEFVDLPGQGTEHCPAATYSETYKFEIFDLFVIVTSLRFTELDLALTKNMETLGKRFLFVRTKIAQDMDNNRASHPRSHDEREELSKIRKDCECQLQRAGTKALHIFLVDSYKPKLYDFGRLIKEIVSDENHLIRETLAHSVFIKIKEVLDLKTDALKNGVWYFGFRISITLGYLLKSVCSTQLQFYKTQLSLDDAGLPHLSSPLREERKAKITKLEAELMSQDQLIQLFDCGIVEFAKKYTLAAQWANLSINKLSELAAEMTFTKIVSE